MKFSDSNRLTGTHGMSLSTLTYCLFLTRHCRMRAMVKETYQNQISTGKARPSNPTPPPVPFEQLPGVYRNLGYGDLELCYVSAPPLDSESESCRQLREDQPVMLPDAVRKDIPTFLARWDRFWYSYVKLEHIDGALFSFQALESQVCLFVVPLHRPGLRYTLAHK
jgi:hypothetical protein